MITEVSEAILDKLKASGLNVREIAFKDLIDRTINLDRPAVNVTINAGTFEKVTTTTYKSRLEVSMIVIFGWLRAGVTGEMQRKEGVYKLLEAIFQALCFQKLTQDMENPLMPSGFRNITTLEYAKAGYQLYQTTMWTTVNFTKTDSDDQGTITSILAQYFLQPRDYTGMQGVTGPELSSFIGLTGAPA
jgi:hypothetical protein